MTWKEESHASGLSPMERRAVVRDCRSIFTRISKVCTNGKEKPSGVLIDHTGFSSVTPRDHKTIEIIAEFILLRKPGIYTSPGKPFSYKRYQPQQRG